MRVQPPSRAFVCPWCLGSHTRSTGPCHAPLAGCPCGCRAHSCRLGGLDLLGGFRGWGGCRCTPAAIAHLGFAVGEDFAALASADSAGRARHGHRAHRGAVEPPTVHVRLPTILVAIRARAGAQQAPCRGRGWGRVGGHRDSETRFAGHLSTQQHAHKLGSVGSCRAHTKSLPHRAAPCGIDV